MNRLLRLGIAAGLFILLVFTTLPNHLSAATGSFTPEEPRDRLNDLAVFRIYNPDNPARIHESTPDQILAAPRLPWTLIAFESYRDGNWEIYTGMDDGSGQTRLTSNPAVDIQSSLNRGATRVVFASDRTGSFEIFSMNPDGSGLLQLTNNDTDDITPAWSPDGLKIAFQSYRDGQAEIYVMGADGAQPTRLTYNNDPVEGNDYDGEPTWSPDGKKIAFVSKRTGGYRVYRMDSDGANQVSLSSQPYSARPAWSPDGRRIAFDSDQDGDGWQEIWMMNADGSNQLLVIKAPGTPDQYTEVRAGSWSPDGNTISLTNLTWIYTKGTWYWTSARIRAFDPNTSGFFSLSQSSLDWSPNWQTKDSLSPVSNVLPMPAYSRASNAEIHWTGADRGDAGIASYGIQYRIQGASVWQNWLTGTTDTSGLFSGAPGTTVYFRSRARDHAYNVENWPATPNRDTHTTLYTWQIQGTVQDVRENSLPSTPLDIQPAPVFQVLSGQHGFYQGYLKATGSHTLSATRDGFSELPIIALEASMDLTSNIWLPPDPNQIVNGDFELGDLSGWQDSGEPSPILSEESAHSGQAGMLLGQSPPGARPRRVTDSALGEDMPAIALDHSGIMHIAWREFQDNTSNIKYSQCSADQCQPAQTLFTGKWPQIDAGTDGTIHLIWIQESGITARIMYSNRISEGIWNTPQEIGTGSDSFGGTFDIAIDQSGRLLATWTNNRQIYFRYRENNGAWSNIEQVSSSGTRPTIAVGEDGIIHIAWAPGYGWDWVGYNSRISGSGWGTPHLIESMYYNDKPSLAVDGQKAVHIVWPYDTGNGKVIHSTILPHGGSWSPITTIQSSVGDEVQLVKQFDHRLLMAWNHAGDGDQLLAYLREDGSWSKPSYLFGSSWPSSIYTQIYPSEDSAELAIATASIRNEKWIVYYSRFNFKPEESQHTIISQAVHIPGDFHAPTLSFMYSYQSQDNPNNDNLRFFLKDTTGTETLLTATPTQGWTHTWFDLNKWLGQTITITLEYSQTANDLYTWAMIDEISLGPWLTPVILDVSPGMIADLPNPLTGLTIQGENFLPTPTIFLGSIQLSDVVWLDENTIKAVIPAGLEPGLYDVRVVNPGGQEMFLLDAFRAGHWIYLPELLR